MYVAPGVTYPLCLIPNEILVPSEYNKFVDATGIVTPVPETVLTVKVNKKQIYLLHLQQ